MACSAGSGSGWSRKLPWIVRRLRMVLSVSLVGAVASVPSDLAGSAPSPREPAERNSRELPASALCFKKLRREDVELGVGVSRRDDFIVVGGRWNLDKWDRDRMIWVAPPGKRA